MLTAGLRWQNDHVHLVSPRGRNGRMRNMANDIGVRSLTLAQLLSQPDV